MAISCFVPTTRGAESWKFCSLFELFIRWKVFPGTLIKYLWTSSAINFYLRMGGSEKCAPALGKCALQTRKQSKSHYGDIFSRGAQQVADIQRVDSFSSLSAASRRLCSAIRARIINTVKLGNANLSFQWAGSNNLLADYVNRFVEN